ncbi:hypothetical protein [Paenibacillus bovis]|uniref:Uncharacterized protein n=1 Tax=Paenibacillus bovis TaxID=1616788 RepID=A0A1X9T418_9BACL|nr:hypothetical protein [Paenibacillus bovis]ARR10609.1 hypothetical protein AR543_p0001 [Paenibacillus bovis]
MINTRDRAIILERMRYSKRLIDNGQLHELIQETELLMAFLVSLEEHKPDARRAQLLEELQQQHQEITAIREKNLQLVNHMPDYEKERVLDALVTRMDNDPLFHQQLVAALGDVTGANLKTIQ